MSHAFYFIFPIYTQLKTRSCLLHPRRPHHHRPRPTLLSCRYRSGFGYRPRRRARTLTSGRYRLRRRRASLFVFVLRFANWTDPPPRAPSRLPPPSSPPPTPGLAFRLVVVFLCLLVPHRHESKALHSAPEIMRSSPIRAEATPVTSAKAHGSMHLHFSAYEYLVWLFSCAYLTYSPPRLPAQACCPARAPSGFCRRLWCLRVPSARNSTARIFHFLERRRRVIFPPPTLGRP